MLSMNNYIYIDAGNSRTKWKIQGRYYEISTSMFDFEKLPHTKKIWLSNVSSEFIINNDLDIFIVKSEANYKSLTNSYKEPHLLGSDRWLAMVALYELNQSKDFILIDIGTAITIDIVKKSGVHLGGLIFPGLAKIRGGFDIFPISFKEKITGVGQSTEECWSIGTLNLVVNTINYKIRELKNELPDAVIFLTGGGYSGVQNFIDFNHHFYEHLVLDGLELYADNVG